MQCGVAVKVGFQAGRANEGQLGALGLRQRAEPQLLGRAHREVPLLKKSGWYGRSDLPPTDVPIKSGSPGSRLIDLFLS